MYFLKCSFLILFAFIFLKNTQGARIINRIVAKYKTAAIGKDKNKDIIAHLIGEIDALKERVGDLEKYRKLAENEESGIIENHYTGQEFLPDSCEYEIQWSEGAKILQHIYGEKLFASLRPGTTSVMERSIYV